MLDKNALSQLQGLKDKIEAEKEYAEGTVKATRSRFGFVVLDDNREIFLPPDEMQRVLPGDRVSVVIKPAAAKDKSGKNQSTAELEKLVSTSVNNFVGEVVQKGKAFFVAPDIPELMHFTRWLFIPPNARSGAKLATSFSANSNGTRLQMASHRSKCCSHLDPSERQA